MNKAKHYLSNLLAITLAVAMLFTATSTSAWWTDSSTNPETDTSAVIMSGMCGENVTYELRESGNLFISGTGPMYDYETNGPWRSFAYDRPMYVYFDSGVTYIGKKAFFYSYCLKRVEFPDTLVEIGDSAFEGAAELQDIVLPEGLTTIGNLAFAQCGYPGLDGYDFTSVTLPSTIKSIGDSAFMMCNHLRRINLPEGLEYIGNSAFNYCIRLTSIELPDSVVNVGNGIFMSCNSLQYLRLSDNLETLPSNTFYASDSKKKSMTEITLPKKLKTIEKNAIYGLDLATIYIPSNVETIAEKAFGSFGGEIHFYDNAPTFDPNTFVKDVTIYYPADNDTWDSVVGQNFGSTITWIASEDGFGGGSGGNAGDAEGDDSDQSGDTENEGSQNGDGESGDGTGSGNEGESGEDGGDNSGGNTEGGNSGSSGSGSGSEEGAVVDENLAFSGASITLFDDLTVNFKADATLFETYTDPYVVFTLGGAETTVTEYTVEDGMYVFAFDGILPNQMNDTITATLCATADGTVYNGEALSYSVATYCYNMLTKYSDDTYLRTLLVDILNYGAQTQLYTAYNTGALANAGLTDEQKAWASADRAFVSVEDIDFATVADPTAEWHGAGLDLSKSIAVRFEFSAQSTDGLTAQITCGDAVWNVTEFGKNGEYDTVCVSINAGYMSEPIYVTLYDGETAVSNTVCYSIESYASTYSDDAELGALVRAMIKYGDSASAYIS